MTAKTTKMGRPEKLIDQRQFEACIMLPITKEAISNILNCSERHIDNFVKKTYGVTFCVLQAQKRDMFRRNILGKQYEQAMKGDRVMLIWLGKNYCNQTDKIEEKTEITHNVGVVEYKTNLSEMIVESEVISADSQISALPTPQGSDEGSCIEIEVQRSKLGSSVG